MACDPDKINKTYWSTVPAEDILAGVHLPAEELTSVLAPGARVLDVGSGTGVVANYLYDQGYGVVGIDLNQEALEQSQKQNHNIEYIQADITEPLPFADESFDAVVVPYVFVSLIDQAQCELAAEQLMRVLRVGGILWICEATYSADYEERYEIGKRITGLDNVAVSLVQNEPETVKRIIRHYSAAELDRLFQPLMKIFTKDISVTSPSSGMTVNSIVAVHRKETSTQPTQ